MKINASISILGCKDGIRIDVVDNDASITFLEVFMTPTNFIRATMERLGNTPCEAKVFGLDKIGKKMECKKLEFPMPSSNYTNQEMVAKEEAQRKCPEGWEPDFYFWAQDSFFYKDQKPWARVTIRRWL